MDTNGFGKMLGRGFGRLMSRVEKPEALLDTLEQSMVRGADAIKSAVDDPKGAANAVARHSKAMADAFKEGYAETAGNKEKAPSTYDRTDEVHAHAHSDIPTPDTVAPTADREKTGGR